MDKEARSALEDLVRRAIQATYSSARKDEVDFVDARYETYDRGTHLLRVRAPEHDLLGYKRWMVVTIDDESIELRGDGHASPGEYYVRVRSDTD